MNKLNLNKNEIKCLFFIRDSVLYKGKTPTLRAIAENLGFKSPRSASLLLESLEKRGYIERTPGGNLKLLKDISGKDQTERSIEVPLVGSAPCGVPFLAEENIEAIVQVSQKLARPGAQYFLLRAIGDSMDKKGIKEGDLMLIRQQPVADEGERIVALIDGAVTVKEFHRKGDHVVLMPRSSRKSHQPIILNRDFMIQGIVVAIIPKN
ncbi:MAG: transcriptional repressor LexA [Patescibacteria group bacterium]